MYHIDIQQISADGTPSAPSLRKWSKAALKDLIDKAELTIRIVDDEEMAALNEQYRGKKGPTNVLSFPFQAHETVKFEIPLLGDIVICPSVVKQESVDQAKDYQAHFAHMVVHGVLHLLGYDHQTDAEAEEMEGLEIKIMQRLGFDDPYNIRE